MVKRNAKVRLARLAGRQFGRVSKAQLKDCGLSDATVHKWCEQGYLHHVRPRVYAVGHRARTVEAELAEALLYAGPGAMLSHATAAWWIGLVTSRPYMIEVSTPRRCRSIPRIRVHARRPLPREWHKNLPVTEFTRTLLDYAGVVSLTKLRVALARADYQGEMNISAISEGLERGRRGSAKLRRALERHQPMLARARSGIEVDLFELCEANRLPLPELNADFAGWEVDALWRRERLAVELDGPGNHRTPAQIRRDRRKELDLRAAGFPVIRYSDEQMKQSRRLIAEELGRLLDSAA